MQFGQLPSDWKLANVVPIYKKGISSSVANYRPISLTSSCSKIFESSIKCALLEFLSEHDVISSSQHGFLSKKSTCTNLLECLNDWTDALDSYLSCLVVYVDFSKAFDSVTVPKLLYKLHCLGIGGKLLACLESFLTERKFRVKIGNSYSVERPVLSGVPQGSVLGPILFIIFVNDLTNSLPDTSKSKLFADDMKSYFSFSDPNDTASFTTLLDHITMWSLEWQLPLAPNKCSWLLITNKQSISKEVSFSFNLAGITLTRADEVTDLGILFNGHLNFSDHITNIIGKAKQRLYLIKKTFTSSDLNSLLIAFKSYIVPMLEYCSPVWSPSAVGDIVRIEAVQRSFTKYLAARFLNNCSFSYKERLTKFNIISLERRRMVADLVLFYKIIYGLVDVNISTSFTKLNNARTRGHSLRMIPCAARLNSRVNFFTLRTIKIWNNLAANTVLANSPITFKKLLQYENFDSSLVFI